MSAEIGCTPAQAALAWVLAQGEDIVAIPGTRTIAHLRDNAGAGEITLTSGQIDRLSSAVRPSDVAGDRYPPQAMAFLGR